MTTEQETEMRRDPTLQYENEMPIGWPQGPPRGEAEGRDPEEVPPPDPISMELPAERG